MLVTLKTMTDSTVYAVDGTIGTVHDILVETLAWQVAYIEVDTSQWQRGDRLRIPPDYIEDANWIDDAVVFRLTKQQLLEGPETVLDADNSAQPTNAGYLTIPAPADSPGASGAEATSAAAIQTPSLTLRLGQDFDEFDVMVSGHKVGHVEDLVVDDEHWLVRYLVVDTREFQKQRAVLLSVDWIASLDWDEQKVEMDVSKGRVETCPAFEPLHRVTREYEEELFDHYARPRYWVMQR